MELPAQEQLVTKIPRSKPPQSKSFLNAATMDNKTQNVVMAMKQEIARTLKKARAIGPLKSLK